MKLRKWVLPKFHLPNAYDSITDCRYFWKKNLKEKKNMGKWFVGCTSRNTIITINAFHIFVMPYSKIFKKIKGNEMLRKENGRNLKWHHALKAGTESPIEMGEVTFDQIIGYWFWHHGSYLRVWLDMISSAYPLNVLSHLPLALFHF